MAQSAAGPLDVSVARVRVPFRRPFVTSSGRWTQRESWILRLRGAGTTGYGEVALDPAAGASELEAMDAAVRDLVAAFAGDGDGVALLAGRPAPIRAGLDAALLGCGAATLDRATLPTIEVNATIDGDDTDDVVAWAGAAVSAGFATLKLKGGTERSPNELAGRIGAVRDAVGPAVRLRLDVNGSWDLARAHAALDAVRPFDLEYVEQPLAALPGGGELVELAMLRRDATVRIAVDESVTDEDAAQAIAEAGAADVLVVKPARVGGIRAAVRIGDLAAERGIEVVVSTMLETGVGIAAGLSVAGMLGPNTAHGLATADILVSDLLAEPIRAVSGRVVVRDLALLRVDDDAVRRFAVETLGAPW